MARTFVDERGEVTVPRSLVEQIEAEPGDEITFRLVAPKTIVVTLTHSEGRAEVFTGEVRLPLEQELTDVDARPWERKALKYDELPVVTLADMLEFVRAQEPVDVDAVMKAAREDLVEDSLRAFIGRPNS